MHVDGKQVGSVVEDAEARFEVTPGEHEVQLRIDWASSEPLRVNVARGATTTLECRPAKAASWLTGLAGRRGYISLTHG